MSVPPDQAEATFALQGEDHTMGNAIRYMLNKNPHVSFAVSALCDVLSFAEAVGGRRMWRRKESRYL